MTRFVYTDSFASVRSTAISAAYYNKHTYELYVVTKEDKIYGYKGIPNFTFTTFQNSSSLGAFWSTIRRNYRAITDRTVTEFVDDANAFNPAPPAVVKTNAFADDAEYVVTFEVTGTLKVTGTADSMDDAIAKANKILNENMVGNFKVKEVARKF